MHAFHRYVAILAVATAGLGCSEDLLPPSAPQPTSSPGNQIVFSSDRGGVTQLHRISPNGSQLTQLTTGGDRRLFCSVSSDGRRMCFARLVAGDFDLFVANVDGTNEVRVTQSQGLDTEPTWSPDGTQIAFTTHREGDADVYIMNADGSGARALTDDTGVPEPAQEMMPAWSPDGTRIAFVRSSNGGNTVWVQGVDAFYGQFFASSDFAAYPAWAPDGTRIAFSVGGDIYVRPLPPVGVYDDNEATSTNLTLNVGDDLLPSWSPDGTQIAFVSTRAGEFDVYVMAADGTNQRNLTNAPASEELLGSGGQAWTR